MNLRAYIVAAVCVLGSSWASGKTVEDVLEEALPPFKLVAQRSEFDGELLGFDGGEWGGQLVFLSAAGKAQVVLNENVRGIVRDSGGVFVLTGLAHITLNFGAIWELVRAADGTVAARKLIELKGQPDSIRELGGEGVVFLTYKGFDEKNKPAFECLKFHRGQLIGSRECVTRR